MSAVLITGASGFLGRHLLQQLVARPNGLKPVALVRSADTFRGYAWVGELGEISVLEGDLEGLPAAVDHPALEGVTAIIHAAADVHHSRRDWQPSFAVNVDGTESVVRAAAALGARVVFVSSSGTVACSPDPADQPDESAPFCDAVVGDWPYYASKIAAERQAGALAAELGVEWVVVRPPVLLGPGDHRLRSTGHIIKMLNGKLPFLLDGGMAFVDIRDAAEAMLSILELEQPKPAYHLPGTQCGVREFFAMVAAVSGSPAPTICLPYPAALALAHGASLIARKMGRLKSPLPDPVVVEMARHHWGMSSAWAASDLGFAPRPGLQTLADTVEWLRRVEAVPAH
jgi:dihydroflavonol-4-reductase